MADSSLHDSGAPEGLPPPPLVNVMAPDGFAVVATPEGARRLLLEPGAPELGRDATSPMEMTWPGWKAIIRRTVVEMLTDRVALVAAGCAFYGTLALFPAISMLISTYGMLFDPQAVVPQLAVLRDLLPDAAYKLIDERVRLLVAHPQGTLTTRLLFSTAVTLWSSAAGTKSIIAALNLAYEERETRSFLRYQATAFIITSFVVLGTAFGLGLLVGLPAILGFFGFASHQQTLIKVSSFVLLVAAVMLGLALLYRYGPCRRKPRWSWVTPGSAVATVLWVAASLLFSYYVQAFATYDATYGPLGTVVAIMMWFYVTAYAVLLGAELNAELELQTVRDSTDGPPKEIGRRGAYVADHVADERRR